MATDVDLSGLRPVVLGVAYRMVASMTEAEDIAQEALLRIHAAARTEPLRNPEAFATTVTTRLAIDHLRSARVRREAYVGPWLPEPVPVDPTGDGWRAVELAESLSLAFLVVLESLGPVERAAFLLHDAFGYGYDQLATTLDRSEAACRQLVSRARQRVEARRPRFAVDPVEHVALLDRFLAAARAGDLGGLLALLTDDAVMVSDGGAEHRAARLPVRGPDRVARLLARIVPRVVGDGVLERTTVNGVPGFVVRRGGRVVVAGAVDVVDGAVRAVHWVVNPDKLRWVDQPGGAASQPTRRATEL